MSPGGPSRHLGLDLGATNLKWAVLERDAETWTSLEQGQLPTDAARGADAVLGRMAEIAADARSSWPGIESVGLGVPGLFDADAGITTFLPNLPPDWTDLPVVEPLRERIGLPVRLINDARAFGLAELSLGAGRGCDTMVGLTLGSGVGGVVVVNGRVHFGHDGTGGEVGHQTLLPDGPACTCGNRGCLEALTRADAIAAACGTATAEEAVRAAQGGDERAIQGLTEIGRWLGIGIANLVVVLTPDRVVLGGGVSGAGPVLLDPIRDEVRRRVRVTDLHAVEIVAAELGTWAGAIGAGVHGAGAPVAAGASR
ncbi:MAG TPA: ROK family protein [Patescibacteria group bacterium]|nr:ROK family protein [Patescibacteria group bacterium]